MLPTLGVGHNNGMVVCCSQSSSHPHRPVSESSCEIFGDCQSQFLSVFAVTEYQRQSSVSVTQSTTIDKELNKLPLDLCINTHTHTYAHYYFWYCSFLSFTSFNSPKPLQFRLVPSQGKIFCNLHAAIFFPGQMPLLQPKHHQNIRHAVHYINDITVKLWSLKCTPLSRHQKGNLTTSQGNFYMFLSDCNKVLPLRCFYYQLCSTE